ncbi:MAG: Rne/Rng family ribonuclease [Micromonosporaceae bacterium]
MLENEPQGGSGAEDKAAPETAKNSSTSKNSAPSVLFVAPEVPPKQQGSSSEDTEPERPASRRRTRSSRESTKTAERAKSTRAGERDNPPEEPEAAEKPTRRRSRRKAAEDDAPASAEAEAEAEAEPKAASKRRGKAKAKRDDTAEADEAAAEAPPQSDEDEESGSARRRRRRGRRGRGRGKGGEEFEDGSAEDSDAATSDDSEAPESPTEETSSVRRRRRRRRKGGADSEPAGDDPAQTVVKVRESRPGRDEVQGVAGSTRLEAKRQRRRDGREQRRTRPPILTESEFLARRESVNRVMAIRSVGDRTQIGVLEDGVLVEHYVSQQSSQTMAGNVYLGKVQNVLPSMEAAFIDIGRGRNAVLYAGEVNWDVARLEGRTRTIEQALKPGDSVLVQVTKDPVGHKGARLTSHISLSGRHLVYVPHGNASGISRKLPDTERRRLRDTLKKLVPESAGVIVRTAAEGASEEELSRDVSRLQDKWESIEGKAKGAKPPTLVYEEPELVIRVVRDVFNEDFQELVVQGDRAWGLVEPYLAQVSPELTGRLRRHVDQTDLFHEMRVDEQMLKALDRKVYLPSGGHLVIDRTEAMTVIDVNTGKFTGRGGNLEETVTRNNLEAAEEIVHQLRLRDIGGIIVIDFIDMVLESNRELVLRRLTECLGRDRTKHQVTEITSLGLVQMTRKRVGQGLLDAFSETCEHCRGRGVIVDTEAVAGKSEPKSAAAEVKRVAAASGNGEVEVAGVEVPAQAKPSDSEQHSDAEASDADAGDSDTAPDADAGADRAGSSGREASEARNGRGKGAADQPTAAMSSESAPV